MKISTNGMTSASSGVWRPTIAERSSLGSPVTSASVVIGMAMAPNATGAVSATSATAAALMRLEAEADQDRAADRHRRPEPGQRLQQRAEAERDHHDLDALVVRHVARTRAAAP